MKKLLGLFLVCILCSFSSCVSKKKYLALEEVRSSLETQNIRQYKTIDTLRVELQSRENQIYNLQRDTARLIGSLSDTRSELGKVQTYLSSSKKELNERIRELQRRDTSISNCKHFCLSYGDSLEILRKDIEFMLKLLIADDTSYKEVYLKVENQELQMDAPESFFFTPNNRNFISIKGKEVLKIVAQLHQKYPSIYIDVRPSVNGNTSAGNMKEPMDRSSLRAAAICRSLIAEHQVPAAAVRCGLHMQENEEHTSHRMQIYFSFDLQNIFDAIEQL